jgi:hypothetical protein
MRAILDYCGEGLLWMGVLFGMSAEVAAEINSYARRRTPSDAELGDIREHPDQRSMVSLSIAERVVWAELVERLR